MKRQENPVREPRPRRGEYKIGDGVKSPGGDRTGWSGVGGDYVVTLGPECHAELHEPDPALPTMRTSVNTFTRLWLGVRSPSGLRFTCPDLDAPGELLERLDRTILLPPPQVDWGF